MDRFDKIPYADLSPESYVLIPGHLVRAVVARVAMGRVADDAGDTYFAPPVERGLLWAKGALAVSSRASTWVSKVSPASSLARSAQRDTDPELGPPVAIKEVLPSGEYDVDKYFQREVKVMQEGQGFLLLSQ